MNSLGRTGWVGSQVLYSASCTHSRLSIVQRVPRQRRRRVTASGRYSDRLRRCLLPLSPRLIALEAGLRFERSGTVDTPDHGPNLKARGRSRFFELHPARVRGFARLSTGTDHESVPGAFGTVAGALPREFVPVRIFSPTDFRRQPSVVTCRSQWSARPLSLVLIVSSPFRAMVDSLFIDDQATVLTDGFDRVRSDPAIALRTWVRTGVCLDVLVEACFVDVSCRHVFSPIIEIRRYGEPLTH